MNKTFSNYSKSPTTTTTTNNNNNNNMNKLAVRSILKNSF